MLTPRVTVVLENGVSRQLNATKMSSESTPAAGRRTRPRKVRLDRHVYRRTA
jgi:hypothetical protein